MNNLEVIDSKSNRWLKWFICCRWLSCYLIIFVVLVLLDRVLSSLLKLHKSLLSTSFRSWVKRITVQDWLSRLRNTTQSSRQLARTRPLDHEDTCFTMFLEQIDPMMPCFCSVIDHRWRQNVWCDLLLYRPTATWNLYILQDKNVDVIYVSVFQ